MQTFLPCRGSIEAPTLPPATPNAASTRYVPMSAAGDCTPSGRSVATVDINAATLTPSTLNTQLNKLPTLKASCELEAPVIRLPEEASRQGSEVPVFEVPRDRVTVTSAELQSRPSGSPAVAAASLVASFCVACGSSYPPGSSFCRQCGRQVDGPSQPQPTALPQPGMAPGMPMHPPQTAYGAPCTGMGGRPSMPTVFGSAPTQYPHGLRGPGVDPFSFR